MAQAEGIMLDPVYTWQRPLQGMLGLLDSSRNNKKGSKGFKVADGIGLPGLCTGYQLEVI